MFDNPIFRFEVKSLVRLRRSYAARSGFVLMLLAALTFVRLAMTNGRPEHLMTIRGQAEVGSYFTLAIMGTQLGLVLLAAPAAAAGAICVDKSRGTLAHILTTDLSSAEVVLGKLAGRIVTIAMILACSWPVSALAALLGGVDPIMLNHGLLVTVGVGLVSCSLSLALSVWGKKTHEVLIISYLLLGAWVFARPIVFLLRFGRFPWVSLPAWYDAIDPSHLIFGPYVRPGSVSADEVGGFLLASTVASGLMMVPAILGLRRALVRHAETSKKRDRPRFATISRLVGKLKLPGPSLDANPVLWREWHMRSPSSWWRVAWSIYWLGSVVSAYVVIATFMGSQRNTADPSCMLVGFTACAGFLLLSVVSSTSLSEERARGSLDVLLTTPMSTASIVWGKWWGTYRLVLMIMICPVFTAAIIGVAKFNLLLPLLIAAIMAAQGAAITSLGLFCAVWNDGPGRAAAWCVSIFLLVTIGWVFIAVLATMNSHGVTGPGTASFSIMIGTLLPMITALESSRNDWFESVFWVFFWTFVQFGIAGFLYVAVLRSFDAKLGRIRNRWDLDDFDGDALWERFHRPTPLQAKDAADYWPSGELRPPTAGAVE